MKISKIILGFIMMVLASCSTKAQHISGNWEGALDLGKHSLKLVFHIVPDSLKVTLDSPDQGAYGLDCVTSYLSDDSISVSIPKMMLSYNGKYQDGKITGLFCQGPVKLPLTLLPKITQTNRPQTPKPPFPYLTQEVTIENEVGKSSLAGTLTIPENCDENTPVVVMVTGSGLQNRDEELFEHKPFAVIADFLARNGIASLRYDDRGIGKSKGDIQKATTADFATDANAAVEWLRSKNSFQKIGILGHSEGGLIAYMLGAKSGVVDFIVSIAGPAVKGIDIIAWQNKVALMKSGVSEIDAENFRQALARTFTYKLDNQDVKILPDTKLIELYPQYKSSVITQQLGATLKKMIETDDEEPNYWMIYYLGYNPVNDLKSLKIPALLIYGEKDLQVPPGLNVDVAKKLSPTANIKVYPELNHLMQHAKTGQVEEYKTIEETFAPEVLQDIVSFITGQK